MAEPGRLMGQAASEPDIEDIDADGEYEIDDEVPYEHAAAEEDMPDADPEGHTTDAEGSEVDAEGEDIDEDDEDEAEPVGAVKIDLGRSASSDDEDDFEMDEDAAGDSFSDAKTSDSEADASNTDSEEENQWQAESDGGEEDEVVKATANACM